MLHSLMRSGVENLAPNFAPLYLSSPTYNPARKTLLKLPRKMQLLYQILLKSTTPTKIWAQKDLFVPKLTNFTDCTQSLNCCIFRVSLRKRRFRVPRRTPPTKQRTKSINSNVQLRLPLRLLPPHTLSTIL